MIPGDIILLRGKSLKGKNRIHERGNAWRVRQGYHQPSIAAGKIFIESINEALFHDGQYPDYRWIHPVNDPDFEVIA